MNLNADFLWEKGHNVSYNPVSVVLQQVEYGKRQILFACICESKLHGTEGVIESGYFSERMTEWFHRRYLKLYIENKSIQGAEKDLRREYAMLIQELESVQRKKEQLFTLGACVLLLLENQLVMLQRGNCKILLINKRYNRHQIKVHQQFDEEGICQGKIQKNIGILLCTDDYAQTVLQENCREVLYINKKSQECRLDKRLAEIWQEMGEENRSKAVGAVCIYCD